MGLVLNKLWGNQGSEFYTKSIKSLLHYDGVVMYSTHIEGKSVAERFKVYERSIKKCVQ